MKIGSGRLGRLVALLLAATLALACATRSGRMHRKHHGFTDDRGAIAVVSTMVGNKNVFVPSTIVVTAGKGRALSIYNTTDGPHGFRIAGLGIETILDIRQEQVVELPELEAGRIYDIDCHLHGAHRHATLMVVPAR